MTHELRTYPLDPDDWESFVPYAPRRWHGVDLLSLAIVRVAGDGRTMPIRRTGDGVRQPRRR